MLRKPPWGEEHYWKIISLSDTLLISIPLLVTFQPRDREKVTLCSLCCALAPGKRGCDTKPYPKPLHETGQILYPFVPHHPPPWTSCSMVYLIYIFMLFRTRGFCSCEWPILWLCCWGGNHEFRLKSATSKSWCVGSVYDTLTTLWRWTQICF